MKTLVVSLQLDAMLLTSKTKVKNASANYQQLPYTLNGKDFNSAVPYLGESICESPFDEKYQYLMPGVHLHWVLPGFLTRADGNGETSGSIFPGVPDRWLITRTRNGTTEKTWLVESNFISTSRSVVLGNESAVNVPFHDDNPENKTLPFRFMGKYSVVVPAAYNSPLKNNSSSYLNTITAVGYNPQPQTKGFGEHTFSAFYPNCSSVFGFYDSEITAVNSAINYEVTGLYSSVSREFLPAFLTEMRSRFETNAKYLSSLPELFDEELQLKLVTESGLEITSLAEADVPQRLACFGKAGVCLCHEPSGGDLKLIIGNNSSEALATYLADIVTDPNFSAEEREDILEAIKNASALQGKLIDIGYSFHQLRHERSFSAFEAGVTWTIVAESNNSQAAANNESGFLDLPNNLAELLASANELQYKYTTEVQNIEALRKQIFADWHKYMKASYPEPGSIAASFNPDTLRVLIRDESLKRITTSTAATGTVNYTFDSSGNLTNIQATPGDNTAAALALALQQLQQALNTYNAQITSGSTLPSAILRTAAPPRFWRANDPVIMLAGDTSTSSQFALQNKRLAVADSGDVKIARITTFENGNDNVTIGQCITFQNKLHDLYSTISSTGSVHGELLWHPFMLEWEVEYLPSLRGTVASETARQYSTDFIRHYFLLNDTDPDFTEQSLQQYGKPVNVSGLTVVTPDAGLRLSNAIDEFNSNHETNQTDKLNTFTTAIKNKLEQIHTFSQVLSGFNEALTQHLQCRQLDVADPLGFAPYQDFAGKVADAVDQMSLFSPDPESDFHPIRSGLMRMTKLRLIDTFGRTLDLVMQNLPKLASENMRQTAMPGYVSLKPRFSQPARLNFRIRSAAENINEMNSHPASSPVCGWLFLNHLDSTIAFYDQDGAAIGTLTLSATEPWRAAPNSSASGNITSISNPALQRVVRFLFDKQLESLSSQVPLNESFLAHFLRALDSAKDNCLPDNFSEHPDFALLAGQPLAVVCTSLNLELHGGPVLDQSWMQLVQEISGNGKSDANFSNVKVPIRIGDPQRLNDGLYGFWIENENGELNPTYYSNENSVISDPNITNYKSATNALTVMHSPADEPVFMTMLLDPRGSLYAVSGVVPVKELSIPRALYAAAVNRLSLTFLTAPVLSPEQQISIGLRKENGYSWSWIERQNDQSWKVTQEKVVISKDQFTTSFSDQPQLWDDLINEHKWLELVDGDQRQARVTEKQRRAFPPDANAPNPFTPEVAKRLDSFFGQYGQHIHPFDHYLHIGQKQVIREGWLQLNATTSPKK